MMGSSRFANIMGGPARIENAPTLVAGGTAK